MKLECPHCGSEAVAVSSTQSEVFILEYGAQLRLVCEECLSIWQANFSYEGRDTMWVEDDKVADRYHQAGQVNSLIFGNIAATHEEED